MTLMKHPSLGKDLCYFFFLKVWCRKSSHKTRDASIIPTKKTLQVNKTIFFGGFNYFWNFHPENWGNGIQFDGAHIFQMGGKNHLVNLYQQAIFRDSFDSWPWGLFLASSPFGSGTV